VILLRYLDVVVVILAAPIMLLIGVPAVGYAVGGAAWIALRAAGEGVDRAAAKAQDANAQISIRLGFLLGRLFLLAIAVILVRNGSGRDAGLACLLVIVGAYTVALATSFANRPGKR
jgi:hypothetical protein